MFLEDPLEVPGAVLDFVVAQLGLVDPSVVKRYAERVKTKSDHQQEIRRVYGLRDFAGAQAELAGWVAARAWTSGDGPKAIFLDAVAWLRERKVLLPGVTTLVARVRDETTHRLWRELEGLLTPGPARHAGPPAGGRSGRAGVGPGAVAQGGRRRPGAARRSSRRWTRWRRSRHWGWPGPGRRRWCRRGGWASWPGTG